MALVYPLRSSMARSLACALLALTAAMGGHSWSAVPDATPTPKPARLADGKPNLTGFWTPIGGLLDRNFGAGAVATKPNGATGAQIPRSPHAPLKSPYKERYEAGLLAAARGIVEYDPAALCMPPGMPRMMGATYGMEVLQTAGQVTITSEWQAASRRIWTDDSAHPPEDELLATFAGHSIGRWEGQTLLVDTVGVRDDVLIDQTGLPVSDALHITERIYLSAPGILVDEVTINDPKVFEKPWTHVRRYRYRPEMRLQDYVCAENNRNVGVNGEPVFP